MSRIRLSLTISFAALAVATALLAASAYANPLAVGAFAIRTIFPHASQAIARITAFVNSNATPLTFLGIGYLVTVNDGSLIPLDDEVGLSPRGYSNPGAPYYGTLTVVEDPSTRERTAVVVNTRTREEVLNPDLGDTRAPVVTTGPWTLAAAPHVYFTSELLGNSGSNRPRSLVYADFPVPMVNWLIQYLVAANTNHTLDAYSLQVNSACESRIGSTSNSKRYFCYQRYPKGGGTVAWAWFTLDTTTPAKTCPTDYEYSGLTNTCVFKPASIDDGYCLVSPSSASAKFEYNSEDPDCIKAVGTGGMSFTPGSPGGSGTPPVAPSVSITDPASGRVLIQEAPSLVDSTAPITRVVDRVPDLSNGTTKETVTTIVPGTSTSSNPSAAPIPSQTVQNIYPGTNPSTSTQGSPMQQVSVSNWPATINVSGTVACSNCSGGAAAEFPTSMKIDGEVPPEHSNLPAAPADLPEAGTVLDPVKEKLAGFLDFQLPAHASTCPSINIQWNAWNLNFNASSDYMCQTLAQHRELVQGLMHFVYIGLAILILLGA